MDAKEIECRVQDKIRMSRSQLAPIFRMAARISCVRSMVLRIVCGLEGGMMWSRTYRELMHRYYGVDIGIHSYGPCLYPGRLPAGTRIGNYCSLAAGLQVFRRNHPVARASQHPFFFNASVGLLDHDTIPSILENPLVVGHDVWIGQNVLIAPGCRVIGDGAIIAAAAVVTCDVPPLAVFGGVPARLIRWRFAPELHPVWQASRWWLKPANELAANIDMFTKPFVGGGAWEVHDQVS